MRVASLLALAGIVLALAPAPQAEPAPGAFTINIECHLPPVRAMEFSYSDPTCFNHSGHHHFFLGQDTTYKLRHISGLVFSVEEEFSVPTEGLMPVVSAGPLNVGLHTPVTIETSLDGVTWQGAGTGSYRYLDVEETLAWFNCSTCSLESLYRQNVLFGIEGQGQEFRFLRSRQPVSMVTQGLSGFLDHTRLAVTVDPGTPVAETPAPGSLDLPCEQAMEAIHPLHPCWFGGIDRYDSPSYFHTWFLGNATLDEVEASFIALPWRLDDFFQPLNLSVPLPQVPPPGPEAVTAWLDRLTMKVDQVVDKLEVNVTLQASVDTQSWTDLATWRGRYGTVGHVEVEDLGGLPAQFLRLVPEEHARYGDPNNFAANHHPRGYLVYSHASAEGAFPG